MCHGEIIQAEAKFHCELGLDSYYERIAKKTAILLQCSCKSGAIVSGATEAQIEQMGDYGLNLGFAFQIVDDILDFLGDAKVMGKPKHEDLVQGNLTLPVILLLDHPQYGEWIKDLIIGKHFQTEDLERVDQILNESGIIKKSFAIAISFIEKAKQNLRDLPDKQYREILIHVADKLKARTH